MTHQYLDDNGSNTSSDSYTISAIVTDDDGGEESGNLIPSEWLDLWILLLIHVLIVYTLFRIRVKRIEVR